LNKSKDISNIYKQGNGLARKRHGNAVYDQKAKDKLFRNQVNSPVLLGLYRYVHERKK